MKIENKKRFAFYVTGGASRLLKIVQMYPSIVEQTFLVINDEAPNISLSNYFRNSNVNYIEFSYVQLNIFGNEKNDYVSNLLLEKFKDHKIDYCFCFGSKILKGQLLDNFKNKIINFHPSILPMHPGTKSIDKAIKANSFLLGNSAHFIDAGVDTGPLIMQSVIHTNSFNEYEDVLALQLKMIFQIFIWLNDERISVKEKKVHIDQADYSQISYYPKLEFNNY